MTEKLNPVRITDHEKGKVYELDFSRESVIFAERRQFKPAELLDFPNIRLPELFFYAFRKNHRNIARAETDRLLGQLGDNTAAVINRLAELYQQAGLTHQLETNEGDVKNDSSTVTVEL